MLIPKMPQTFLAVTKAPNSCQQLIVIPSSPACNNDINIQKDMDVDNLIKL